MKISIIAAACVAVSMFAAALSNGTKAEITLKGGRATLEQKIDAASK